jgi:hypothetical protein
MPKFAVFECPCCSRRVSIPVAPGGRVPGRTRCDGWCRRCDGACHDLARRVAVERDDGPVALEAPVADAVRLVKPSARLDLPDFRPQDLAW